MLIDSHCHLNFIDLAEFDNSFDKILELASQNDVKRMLCVCVDLSDYPALCAIAERYKEVQISVGSHPNSIVETEPDATLLSSLASHPACIAIGETGLDYYRTEDREAQEQQRIRFREHIRASLETQKPLIIHTRQSANDTLRVLREEGAERVGGVMHCFSEDWEIAKQALELNFYISLSGIVTFKSATVLQDVARKVPLDRLLIETDSPYLAPVPFRGKQNHPALVKYVAQSLAELKQLSYEQIAEATSSNFDRCFRI